MDELLFFPTEEIKPEVKKPVIPVTPKPIIPKKEEIKSIEDCIKAIKSDMSLWDMRCWNKYKDDTEIFQWITNDCYPNNCGHVAYCIGLLRNHYDYPIEKIMDAVKANNNPPAYKLAPVRCFDQDFDHPICPYWKTNYSDTGCWQCQGYKHDPMEVIRQCYSFKHLFDTLEKDDKYHLNDSINKSLVELWNGIFPEAKEKIAKDKNYREWMNKNNLLWMK